MNLIIILYLNSYLRKGEAWFKSQIGSVQFLARSTIHIVQLTVPNCELQLQQLPVPFIVHSVDLCAFNSFKLIMEKSPK